MALVVGGRIGLITYTLGTDPRPGRIQHNEERNLLESRLVIGDQGTSALRPTAGKGKALYWNTDRNVLQWDTSTGWEDVSTVGGGGAPAPISVAGTATEGVALRGARADHVHVLPLATTSAHGGMSSADKAKLDNAVVTPTGDRLVIRDVNGRTQFASPAASADAATKGYVDSTVGGAAAPTVTSENNGLATPTMLAATNQVATASTTADPGQLVLRDVNGRAQFANPSVPADAANKGYVDGVISSHRHDASHINTGTFSAARLPIATTTANGAMATSDKIKLDGASPSATNGALVMRDESGRAQFGAPSVAGDAATKGYVDTGLNAKANGSHSHLASDITSGTMSTARLPYANTTNATDGIITATQLSLITSHNHDASAINTGTFSAARLPVASSTSSGIISATTYSQIYSHYHSWSEISSKPSTYEPSWHSHDGSEITSGIIPHVRVQGSKPAYDTIGTSNGPGYAVYVDATGRFYRPSSTTRHKTHVRPWNPNPRDLLGPVPSIFDRIDPNTGETLWTGEIGVIAEQAGETLPEFVQIGPDTTDDDTTRVQGWDYTAWTTAHQILAQWFDKRLARIEDALGLDPLEEV